MIRNPPGNLLQRRHTLEEQWSRFQAGSPFLRTEHLRDDIVGSWQRSASHVEADRRQAPSSEPLETDRRWKNSALYQSAQAETSNIQQLVKEGELVAAIADPCGQILWTSASDHMQRRAEAVNFATGGHWDECSVGTNAVGLALKLLRPVTVFSSEHYQPFVHDWVCYASPILHPQSGQCLGVLDISSTWNRHTPLGQAAVTELARSIASHLPHERPRAELEIHALGQPRVLLNGQSIALPRRQLEILCLLALNPEGLDLQALHAALYGDARVSLATLKSELSHLRRRLDGKIDSRPYRLLLPVWADFIELWHTLKQHQISQAMALYRGPLLVQSASPEIEEWRYCIDAMMNQSLATCEDSAILVEQICGSANGSDLVRERLAALLERR